MSNLVKHQVKLVKKYILSFIIENGNPFGIPSLYSASLLDASTKTQPVEPVIYRPELRRGDKTFQYLRTPKFDSDWLNREFKQSDNSTTFKQLINCFIYIINFWSYKKIFLFLKSPNFWLRLMLTTTFCFFLRKNQLSKLLKAKMLHMVEFFEFAK